MKTIVEYLLSNKSRKTLSLLDEIKKAMKGYEKEFEAVLQVLEKHYEDINFDFIISTILKMINEDKFVLSYKYDEVHQKFETVTGIAVLLDDDRTKIVRILKFGREGLGLEIVNIKKLTLFSIIVSPHNFELYSIKLENIGEILANYDEGCFNWETDVQVKSRELNDDDIEQINKIFEKIV